MMDIPPLPGPYKLLEVDSPEWARSLGPVPVYLAEHVRFYGESCARMAREEAAKVEADALRYQWLKATNRDALICFAYGASDAACEFAPSDIDAAIDTAIRKGEREPLGVLIAPASATIEKVALALADMHAEDAATVSTFRGRMLTLAELERLEREMAAMPTPLWTVIGPDGRIWQDTDPKTLLRVLALAQMREAHAAF